VLYTDFHIPLIVLGPSRFVSGYGLQQAIKGLLKDIPCAAGQRAAQRSALKNQQKNFDPA
jgi:hypothetical protein